MNETYPAEHEFEPPFEPRRGRRKFAPLAAAALLLPLLALAKAPSEAPQPEPAVTAAPTAAPAELPETKLRFLSFASLCELEVRFPVPEDIVSAEITFFDPNFPDEETTLAVSESAMESGVYRVMRETHSVREAHPEYYTDAAVECTLSVRAVIAHIDGRVETLFAERPAAQRFTIACGYEPETDTVTVFLTPRDGAAVPEAVIGSDPPPDENTVCVWPETEGFDPLAASAAKSEYSTVVTLPLPEEHAGLVTVHVYFLPDGEIDPFDFAETVRTVPRTDKEAAS